MPKGGSGKSSAKIQRSQALITKLDSVESKIVKRKTEKAVILDADGNVIFEKSGSKTQVGFTTPEMTLMKDAIITHNHPGEEGHTVFSQADLRTAINVEAREMRAVNQVSQVSFLPDKNGKLLVDSNAKKQFLNAYQLINTKMNAAIDAHNAEYNRSHYDYGTYKKGYDNIVVSADVASRKFLQSNQKKFGYLYDEKGL